ncbi:MAG: AbrB/MazE/SpoVT family DNA-binding domain-containing protein [Candidatus Hodarchaeales archaeon]|jgi:AbrB family looped-hinge helix DNA binding protein
MIEIKVGSKGELFLPKSLQEQLGLKPGDRLFIEVVKDELVIKKAPDLLELVELPPISSLQTPEDIERDLEEMQSEQMELSTKGN